ncbi:MULTISPECIES: SAM-dependent methyltransferase [Clostridium]|uniref:Cyclopropane-fatty-acyl-phospholipid synthase n=2 Tax=Clostridium TaxID=1485 RepID=D8GNN0_CLOLD|nr:MULTISPECIES: cyclopropane-fatty-acyl-phospholipid synthase family protein [Clostridium]ADK15893.1 cyclopropane-fatty-acyl-phospholipid synthase [Clostridium ljungdahlii DSM 13528]AGY75067.1 cyclopropane-fatty-acyl-phospholipid synthase family protein [Clostridium autoethanogenum DSM 10061]ALU35240.1 Cyclopropane-fatty-acyl-phospholipid synthase [Clostridium autoethanogenum DSM 10061]OAA87229.1 Cyclopropane-fatty-acyl-phospholipid synthase [Clostridium ljungdahlii DSM 13528]OVY49681.1 Cyclo
MGLDKIFFRKFLQSAFSDTVAVKYWDGSEEKYGEGDIKFKVCMNKPISEKDILRDPFLTLGEAYMDGILDFEGNIREILESVYKNRESFLNKADIFSKVYKILPNTLKRSKTDVQYHYDQGNDFYSLWLDKTMSYSCAYFKHENDSLYQAQLNKVDHILKKLNLKEGQTLLDIGCGWGELILMAAKKYGVKAVGITLSKEQLKKANERIEENNLQGKVEVKLADYRELADKKQKFDRIVSVGMIEHVGRKNLSTYMEDVRDMLNPGGVSLLHCITAQTEGEVNEWIKRYIFPGGYIPSIRELVSLMADNDLHLVDAESLRLHYFKTLKCWAENFEGAIDEVKKMKDTRFIRMWRLYLNACAASFHYGVVDIHQFVFTKGLNNELPMTRKYLYED